MNLHPVSVKILFFVFILAANQAIGQETITLDIRYLQDKESNEALFPPEHLEVKSQMLKNILTGRLNTLYNQAYLAAWYDLKVKGKRAEAVFYTGDRFELASLSRGNLDLSLLNKVGYTERFYRNKPFSYKEISGLMRRIIRWAENNGYPFASVKMDSITIRDHQISGMLYFDSGPLIVFDSIAITGIKDLKYKFLMSQLGVYKGKPYRQDLIDEIPQRIKTLEFAELTREPEVTFVKEKAIVYMELKKRKINQVDGLIGFLPNENNGNKLLVTGQLKLDLHNLFASGKRLYAEWQRVDQLSQFLDLRYSHPKLLRSPLDFSVRFYLLKQDTVFINKNFVLQFSFIPGVKNHLTFTTDFESSRLISTESYRGAEELPPYADFNLTYYGLEYSYNTLDDFFLPSRGLLLEIKAFAGQKKIKKNPAFDEQLYEGMNLNTAQYKVTADLDQYFSIRKNFLLRFRLRGGYLGSSELFFNDLFRLGGLTTLRGFNENFFYASQYALANIELRTVFSDNTYFLIFYDQAYMRNRLQEMKQDYPLGVGAGFSLVTRAGIFNLVFALGKSHDQDFGFNYSKIHFGYIGQF
jgi:outer membrane protein assembly factor BamA